MLKLHVKMKLGFHRRYRLPAECGKQANGWLLDQLVFGVGVGTHEVANAAIDEIVFVTKATRWECSSS